MLMRTISEVRSGLYLLSSKFSFLFAGGDGEIRDLNCNGGVVDVIVDELWPPMSHVLILFEDLDEDPSVTRPQVYVVDGNIVTDHEHSMLRDLVGDPVIKGEHDHWEWFMAALGLDNEEPATWKRCRKISLEEMSEMETAWHWVYWIRCKAS